MKLSDVDSIYAGSTEIAKVYHGSTLVWEKYTAPPPTPYTVTVNGGFSKDGQGNNETNFVAGDTVVLTPYHESLASGYVTFDGWTVVSGGVTISVLSAPSFYQFTMPSANVEITANFSSVSNVVTVNGGNGSGTYNAGDTVTISPSGYPSTTDAFVDWTLNSGNLVPAQLANLNANANGFFSFTMPSSGSVVITANYSSYAVTVTGGTGGGTYQFGETVTISPTLASGDTFSNWTVNPTGLPITSIGNQEYTFTMPASAVELTANITLADSDGDGIPDVNDYWDNNTEDVTNNSSVVYEEGLIGTGYWPMNMALSGWQRANTQSVYDGTGGNGYNWDESAGAPTPANLTGSDDFAFDESGNNCINVWGGTSSVRAVEKTFGQFEAFSQSGSYEVELFFAKSYTGSGTFRVTMNSAHLLTNPGTNPGPVSSASVLHTFGPAKVDHTSLDDTRSDTKTYRAYRPSYVREGSVNTTTDAVIRLSFTKYDNAQNEMRITIEALSGSTDKSILFKGIKVTRYESMIHYSQEGVPTSSYRQWGSWYPNNMYFENSGTEEATLRLDANTFGSPSNAQTFYTWRGSSRQGFRARALLKAGHRYRMAFAGNGSSLSGGPAERNKVYLKICGSPPYVLHEEQEMLDDWAPFKFYESQTRMFDEGEFESSRRRNFIYRTHSRSIGLPDEEINFADILYRHRVPWRGTFGKINLPKDASNKSTSGVFYFRVPYWFDSVNPTVGSPIGDPFQIVTPDASGDGTRYWVEFAMTTRDIDKYDYIVLHDCDDTDTAQNGISDAVDITLPKQSGWITPAYDSQDTSPAHQFKMNQQTARENAGYSDVYLDASIYPNLARSQVLDPIEINGYYPLYTDPVVASTASTVNANHQHTFNGTTYYMPSGFTEGDSTTAWNASNTFWHGDFPGQS